MFKTGSLIYTQARVQDEYGIHMFRAYEPYVVCKDDENGKFILDDNGVLYPLDVVAYMFNYVQ